MLTDAKSQMLVEADRKRTGPPWPSAACIHEDHPQKAVIQRKQLAAASLVLMALTLLFLGLNSACHGDGQNTCLSGGGFCWALLTAF